MVLVIYCKMMNGDKCDELSSVVLRQSWFTILCKSLNKLLQATALLNWMTEKYKLCEFKSIFTLQHLKVKKM